MLHLTRSRLISLSCFVFATGITLHSFLNDSYQVTEKVVSDLEVTDSSLSPSASLSIENTSASSTAHLVTHTEPCEKNKKIVIGKGDTMMSVLSSIGMTPDQAHLAVAALRKVYNPRALKCGQELHIAYKPAQETESVSLLSVDFKTSTGHDIALRYQNGEFVAEKFEVQLMTVHRKVAGQIHSSFYSAALKQGVPAQIVKEAISALSYDINWQHDPQSGNKFVIAYEEKQDSEGNVIKVGNLKFAAFAPNGNWRKIYAFQNASGTMGYYNEKGESIVRSLLQTPLDPTRMRVTSKFGIRRHPLLGYSKMHKGVDFGAPVGTPVMAAGDGVVLKAGWNGAYGNYILVRHNAEYSTAYAHLSKLNVKPGMRVRQRQVIGAVGSTGRSTGAHLHYECIQNGKHVNPQLVKQLPTSKLIGKEFAKFQEVKAILDRDNFINGQPLVAVEKIPLNG